jgi:hypothetical protein
VDDADSDDKCGDKSIQKRPPKDGYRLIGVSRLINTAEMSFVDQQPIPEDDQPKKFDNNSVNRIVLPR